MRTVNRNLLIGLALASIGLFTMGNTGCDDQSSRQQMAQERESNTDSAIASVPVPKIHNYAAREAVARQVKRMDQVGKLYYIYLMSQNGSIIGYYISETRPISVCAALTPVDDVQQSSSGSLAVTKAPGLQGTYGGSDCGRYFFFDAETKALGEVPSALMLWFDAPLAVNAPQIKVTISK